MVNSLPDDMGPIDPAKRDPNLPPAKYLGKPHIGQVKHESDVKGMAWSPDGTMMAAGGYDKKIIIWDVETFDKVRTIETEDWVECLDWSPDGELIGCGGGFDKKGKIYEFETGELMEDLEHGGIVYACAFAPKANVFACGCFEKMVTLWHSTRGHMITSITTEGVLKALAWHPENTAIASGGFCAAVTVWKMNVDEEKPKEEILWRNELENIAADCRSLAYSADGTKLVSGDWADKLILWDSATGEKIWEIANPEEKHYFAVAFSPEMDVVVAGGWNWRATMYRVADKEKLDDCYIGAETEDHVGGQTVRNVRFSPDGKVVAFCSDDRQVHFWPRDDKTRLPIGAEDDVE
ncbi:WD repeat-containing protein [Aureococcus anophagefferens]|nr:WD repeat-containing protein [Aureococcus anophagefferens]